MIFRSVAVLALCAAIAACATPRPRAPTAASAPAQPAVKPVAVEDDLLLKLLSAQFALQRDDVAEAANGFADAAERASDPALGEEATRLALSVRDWSLARRAAARWQQLAPNDAGVAQARAWIALGEHREDDAYAELESIAARDDEQRWRLIAQALLGAGDKQAAARLLDRLATPQRLGSHEANWVAISQLAFKLDDKALSRRLADAAVARFHGENAYVWSARLALDRGDKAAARALYAEALRRAPDSLRLRGGYAALLADGGDNAGAARVLARGRQDDTTYAARAAYAARADDKAALAALYREVGADASTRAGKRLFLLGQLAEMIDKREEALSWYREIDEDDDHWFDAQMRQAVVLDQLGRTDQAVDFLHRTEAETAEDGAQLGDAYLMEADLLARRGRADAARSAYARALASLPDDTRLLYARALFLIDQGDAAAGERDLRRVVELKPDDAEALNALGYTLADHSRHGDPRQAEALDLIQRALKLKPDEPAIIDSMGWVRYRMGDLDTAVQDLRRAYSKQPDADIAAHLGEVLWVKGERDEARRIWDEGRKKDAKNKTLQEAIRRLTT
ncbi:MAG TPA: tetratricopeptide repeat protein [Dokdonella sp.]